MTDLISREALRDALGITGTKESCKGCQYNERFNFACNTDDAPTFAYVCEAIDNAPTVDAVPVQDLKEAEKERDYWHETASSYERTIVRLTESAVPVRHGKWIDIDEQSYTWKVRCSECGHERSMMSTQGEYPTYCENCGARMDKKWTG